jgi:hypothetical protein
MAGAARELEPMSEGPDISPRRRFRFFAFSVRFLLLVVVLLCAWLGYYIHWKNERQKARLWIQAIGADGRERGEAVSRPELPWMLKFLGDKPEAELLMWHRTSEVTGERPPVAYWQLVKRIATLFPEANVIDLTPSDRYEPRSPDSPFSD